MVTSTVESAPAHQAGIRAGDRIVAVNGEEIRNALDLSRAIQLNLGEHLLVSVERPQTDALATGGASEEPERFEVTVHGAAGAETAGACRPGGRFGARDRGQPWRLGRRT